MSMGVCSDGSLQMGKFGDTDRQSIQTTLLFFPTSTLRLLLVKIQSSLFELASKAGKAKQAIKEMMMVVMDDTQKWRQSIDSN